MKKILFFTLLLTLTLIRCQNDDFCIDPITPNLVIRFYDDAEPDNYKSASNITVWAEGKDTLEMYNNVSTDSLAIQLDPSEDFTIYHLSANGVEDQITIDYLRNEIFVSRSCGYKYNFTELDLINVSNNWILNTEITSQTIENETEHIKILH